MKVFGKMIVFMSVVCFLSISFTTLAGESGDTKTFVISGAGPSTKVVELLAQDFCSAHNEYKIIAPPKSIKHKGGLEWVAELGRLFGRTGRPLSETDRENFPMLVELPIAKVKIAFAVDQLPFKWFFKQWSGTLIASVDCLSIGVKQIRQRF